MEQCTDAEVARLLSWEPKFRCQQALKYKHLFGQFACLKSYELLWLLLKDEGICKPPLFRVDSNGKPFLKDYPNLFFSISHCKEAISAVIDTHPVGIDVEYYRKYSTALLERTMNKKECDIIFSSPYPSCQFIQFWTQKEAVLKLRGTGITHNLHNVLGGPEHVKTWTHSTKPYAYSIATL